MRLLTLAATFTASLSLFAEHLPGGNITVRCISGNQHEVTLRLWRECTGAPMIGQSLTFLNSCGVSFTLNNLPLISTTNVSPVCADQQDQTTCDGGALLGIEEYVYRTNVFLSPCNFWRIYWSTCCRLPSLNLQGSQGIHIEALVNNQGGACNTFPSFSDATPPVVCAGQPVSYDPGVIFTQGQQLRFRLIDARRMINPDPLSLDIQPVIYQSPYTGAAPYDGLAIDSLTGQITFTPTMQGYIVCAMAVEVRDAAGVWRGTIMRDFPFIVQACSNQVPDAASGTVGNLSGSGGATGTYALSACGPLCFDITVTDPDAGQSLELQSNVTTAVPGAAISFAGANPAVATVCVPGALANGTYLFTITALDDACPVRGSQTYTYTLTVESASATAGDDASASICPGQFIDLNSLLTGDPGGVWSAGPLVNAPGSYTYTIATGCGSDEAVFTITESQAPNAGNNSVSTICQGEELDLTTLVTGDPGGTWSEGPLISTGGQYTYTVTNACGSDEALFVITAAVPSSAGEDNAIAVCQLSPPFLLVDSLLGDPAAGGAWTGPPGPAKPAFIPGTSAEGIYCYTLLNPLPCPASTACLTITYLPDTDPACISLGMPETNPAIVLAPNPSDGRLFLSGARATHAEVIDGAGRVLSQFGRSSELGIIELPASLPNGSYAVRLRTSDGRWHAHRFELLR